MRVKIHSPANAEAISGIATPSSPATTHTSALQAEEAAFPQNKQAPSTRESAVPIITKAEAPMTTGPGPADRVDLSKLSIAAQNLENIAALVTKMSGMRAILDEKMEKRETESDILTNKLDASPDQSIPAESLSSNTQVLTIRLQFEKITELEKKINIMQLEHGEEVQKLRERVDNGVDVHIRITQLQFEQIESLETKIKQMEAEHVKQVRKLCDDKDQAIKTLGELKIESDKKQSEHHEQIRKLLGDKNKETAERMCIIQIQTLKIGEYEEKIKRMQVEHMEQVRLRREKELIVTTLEQRLNIVRGAARRLILNVRKEQIDDEGRAAEDETRSRQLEMQILQKANEADELTEKNRVQAKQIQELKTILSKEKAKADARAEVIQLQHEEEIRKLRKDVFNVAAKNIERMNGKLHNEMMQRENLIVMNQAQSKKIEELELKLKNDEVQADALAEENKAQSKQIEQLKKDNIKVVAIARKYREYCGFA